jgi:hypothetical protein
MAVWGVHGDGPTHWARVGYPAAMAGADGGGAALWLTTVPIRVRCWCSSMLGLIVLDLGHFEPDLGQVGLGRSSRLLTQMAKPFRHLLWHNGAAEISNGMLKWIARATPLTGFGGGVDWDGR